MAINKIAESHAPKPICGNISIGSVTLENGQKLDEISLRFEQVGDPNAPAILVCHALTGNHQTVGGKEGEGWWSGLIGPGKSIDTNIYQVITFNALGGCHGSTGPLSINPKTNQPYQSDFPFFTIRDMAMVQERAFTCLGVNRFEAVIGGSLGGMQALELALMYPYCFKKVICLAATPYLSDFGIAFNAIGRKVIMDDSNWQGGKYSSERKPAAGLSTARMLAMLTYRSQDLFNNQFHRGDKEGFGERHDEVAFQVESYLDYQGRKLVNRFDANSYLYLLKAMDSHDIGRGRGGWQKALATLKANLLGIGYGGDLIYPPQTIQEMVEVHQAFNKNSTFIEVNTHYGHDGFLVEFDKWGRHIKEWLSGH
jgi:homoserine O-acetyltransferase/O-succinyltransferase